MSTPVTAPSLLPAALPVVLAALLLSACAVAPAADGNPDASVRMIADGSDFTMQPGETVMLSDRSTLRYASVESDSRCRPDVQCIHAGNAVLAFEFRPVGASAQAFALNSAEQPKSRDLGSLRVTLESLSFDAAPRAQLEVARRD